MTNPIPRRTLTPADARLLMLLAIEEAHLPDEGAAVVSLLNWRASPLAAARAIPSRVR